MHSLFSPEVVQGMTAKEIASIAAESPAIDAKRRQCAERLAVLESGLRDLKMLDRHRPSIGGKPSVTLQEHIALDRVG